MTLARAPSGEYNTRMRAFQKRVVPRPNMEVPPALLQNDSVEKELEIGAGNGEFAFQRAKIRPDIYFIAIEKTRRLFNQMLARYQKHPPPNLWIFHTNAVWWITHLVPARSLHKIYILYPNIYVKPRQANLRWFNRPFMAYLLDRLKPGGTLEIRTNEQKYYEECKLKMKNYSLQKTRDRRLTAPPQTAFERKYMAQGQPCQALIYTRLPPY